MRTESQSFRSVDADAWCKRTLTQLFLRSQLRLHLLTFRNRFCNIIVIAYAIPYISRQGDFRVKQKYTQVYEDIFCLGSLTSCVCDSGCGCSRSRRRSFCPESLGRCSATSATSTSSTRRPIRRTVQPHTVSTTEPLFLRSPSFRFVTLRVIV